MPNIFEKGLVNDSLLYVVATLAVASVGKKTRWGKWKGERKGNLTERRHQRRQRVLPGSRCISVEHALFR